MEEENKPKQEVKNKKKTTSENHLGFFKKVWYSITKFEKYSEMAAQGVGKSIQYLIKIMAIFAIILCVGIVTQLYMMVNKGMNYLEKEAPEIHYKNGVLDVQSETPIEIESTNSVIGKMIIDTKTDQQEKTNQYVQSIGAEESGVVVLKDKVIVKNEALSGAITYSYADIFQNLGNGQITEFKKQDILQFSNSSNMYSFYIAFCIVMFIYTFIIYVLATLVDALVLAVLGYLTTVFARLKIKFFAIYNMAVHALTLSIILNAIYIVVNMFTGFEITYFQVMYTSVAYIYLVAAIFIIKSEFVKKQMELIKIVEEQEKVKEEMKRREEEEEQKQEEENNKEEEPEEKEEKKKEKGKIDGEPEGTNA